MVEDLVNTLKQKKIIWTRTRKAPVKRKEYDQEKQRENLKRTRVETEEENQMEKFEFEKKI